MKRTKENKRKKIIKYTELTKNMEFLTLTAETLFRSKVTPKVFLNKLFDKLCTENRDLRHYVISTANNGPQDIIDITVQDELDNGFVDDIEKKFTEKFIVNFRDDILRTVKSFSHKNDFWNSFNSNFSALEERYLVYYEKHDPLGFLANVFRELSFGKLDELRRLVCILVIVDLSKISEKIRRKKIISICELCQSPFFLIYKREDSRFCCNKCKDTYHNQKRKTLKSKDLRV